MNDGKLDYRDTTKIEIDRNYKFAYLVLALSIGILAFTLENITPDKDTFTKWFLYISWALLFIAFISSFLRIFHLQKSFSKINREIEPDTDYKDRIYTELWYEEIVMKPKFGRRTYRMMIVCFGLGIISFLTYKVLEIIYNNNNTVHDCMHKCLNL